MLLRNYGIFVRWTKRGRMNEILAPRVITKSEIEVYMRARCVRVASSAKLRPVPCEKACRWHQLLAFTRTFTFVRTCNNVHYNYNCNLLSNSHMK